MPIFPKVMEQLQQSLQTATLRHQVIANNIANVNVPGFRSSAVSFGDQLAQSIGNPAEPPVLRGIIAHPRHLVIESQRPGSMNQPGIQRADTGVMRNDGNDVDLEAEMAKLAANQLWYQALVRSMTSELNRMRTVITDGRR